MSRSRRGSKSAARRRGLKVCYESLERRFLFAAKHEICRDPDWRLPDGQSESEASAPLDLMNDASPDAAEAEPNNGVPSANTVSISASPNTIFGSISNSTDVDFYSFTLAARSGVFFDIDSRDVGLSTTLDTSVTVYDSSGVVVQGANNNGRDFETFTLNDTTSTAVSSDSSLYLDLNPGTYLVRVSSNFSTTGNYQFKLTADSVYMSSVPAFNSLPGAADTLYLDFDGHSETSGSWGSFTIASYDLNGNPAEWTPLERMVVYTTWRGVAEDYAPFNLNVSTSYAGPFTDTVGFRQVIGNSTGSEFGYGAGTLGVAFLNAYASGGSGNNTAFTFASNFSAQQTTESDNGAMNSANMARAIEMANTSSHEFGHALGLKHYGGTNAQLNALMHTPDFGLNRERWVSGNTHSSEPPVVFQTDVAVISNATNSFGFRADDHGDSDPGATVLSPIGNTYSANGIIGSTADVDVFRFTGNSNTTISLNIVEHIGNLDGEVYLYNAAGGLLASNDGAALSAGLTYTLPASGNYFVQVRSDAGPGEVGQYSMSITTAIPGGGSISGKAFRDTNLNNIYETGNGDSGLGGVTVFLDANNNGALDGGETSVISDFNGDYSFNSLADGTYHVRQITPGGYVSTASHLGIVISGGIPVGGRDFGNFPIVYNGSSGNDTYTVRRNSSDPGKLEIVEALSGSPTITWIASASLSPSLTINTGGGDDLVTITSANGDPMPVGGIIIDGGAHSTSTADRVSVVGTSGDDSFVLNNADIASGSGSIAVKNVETVTLSGGAGNDDATLGEALTNNTFFDGGASTDSLLVRGTSGSDALTFMYNPTFKRVDRGSVLTAYANIEGLSVDMLGGSDSATITNLAGAPPTTVVGDAGDDTVTINSGSGIRFEGDGDDDTLTIAPDSSSNPVFVGGEGFDVTTFTSTSGDDTITISATTVSDGSNTLNYSSSEELIVEALGGDDTITLSGLDGDVILSIFCGDDNDVVYIGFGDLDSIAGDVLVFGENGTDAVELDDSSVSYQDAYTITSTTVDRLVFGKLEYDTIELLTLDGQSDTNLTTITSTNPATTITINESTGHDTLTVQNSSGPIIYNGGLVGSATDTLNVNGGTFTFNDDANIGTTSMHVHVNSASAAVVFNTTQHLGLLELSAGTATMTQDGANVLVTDELTLGGGTLNLVDNDMIVQNGELGSWDGSAYTGITGAIQAGRGDGSWNGDGIVTSMTDATTGVLTTLALASAEELGLTEFDGETLAPGAVLVKYTWGGDADLNGELNGDDYFYIDSNIINSGSVFGFHNGDFDLNGELNGDDYFILDSNILFAQANPPL